MSILVTGSSGRIGSRLVDALLIRGETVRGFDLLPSGRSSGSYSEVTGAFDDPSAMALALAGIDTVFHLGAMMSWVPTDQRRMFSSNVEGTRVLLQVMQRLGATRLIFASSGEVYPENAPKMLPVDEGHPLNPFSAYGLSKLLGEEMVQWAARVSGLKTTILRFSHTQDVQELLDPDSFFSGPRFFLHARIRQQEALGNAGAVAALRAQDDGSPAMVLARNENGRAYRMMITDVRDMVTGLLLTLDSPQTVGEIYNLGATKPVDFAEVLPIMAKHTGLPLRIVDLPGDGVFYETSNSRFRLATGFNPAFPFNRMMEEAASSWRLKPMS